MTEEELSRIEALANAATPGPWEVSDSEPLNGCIWSVGPICGYDGDALGLRVGDPNADFVAAAREDVPKLIAEVRRQRAELERTKAKVAELIALQAKLAAAKPGDA